MLGPVSFLGFDEKTMNSTDVLNRLLNEFGYELVDPEGEEAIFDYVELSFSTPSELRRIVDSLVSQGHARPNIPKPKDDEAFRLFSDEFYAEKPSSL